MNRGRCCPAIRQNEWAITERANNWKSQSLVWTSLDAALRPIEVENARTSWVDVDNGVRQTPQQDSAKNTETWIVSLPDQTVDTLERWLAQRKTRAKYEGTDALWLTRERNPYQSASLRGLLHRLRATAGIDVENRSMSWYAIRHSTGTYMAREEGLAAARRSSGTSVLNPR